MSTGTTEEPIKAFQDFIRTGEWTKGYGKYPNGIPWSTEDWHIGVAAVIVKQAEEIAVLKQCVGRLEELLPKKD